MAVRNPESYSRDVQGRKNPNWRGGDWHLHAKDKARIVNAKKLAKKHGVENTLTLPEWLEIIEAHNGLCAYCFRPFEELDHVRRMFDGGANSKENVVPACRDCNRRRNGKASSWVPSIASRFWPSMAEELYA